MKESLLLGLSGFRSAALPLPLGVFKPSERYWWPLSPSSSLRLAWNKKVQSFVPGHVDNYEKRGSLGYGPCQCCRLMPALTISVLLTQGLAIPHSQGLAWGWAVKQTLPSPTIITHIYSDGQIQWFFRSRFRSHFVHLFIDSTYVPGMGLDTKNTAGTMELKFTVFQWIFAASLHLWPGLNSFPWALQTLCVYLYHNPYWI